MRPRQFLTLVLPVKSSCAHTLENTARQAARSAVRSRGETMPRENALIVSLDIGTYKTAIVVAEATPEDVEILGVGTALSGQGLRKSQVINIDTTVQAVRRAV